MRSTLLLLFLSLAALAAHPQDRRLSGRVYELNTRIPLQGIRISTPAGGILAATDSTGTFRVPVRTSELLVFSGPGYLTDTLLVIDHAEREVFLTPRTHVLKEVAISSAEPNLGEYRDPEFHGQTVNYQRDKDGIPIGGLIFRIHYWDKDSKKERRSKKKLAQAALGSEIDALFTPLNIGRYIPLKGEELQNFIGLYRPAAGVYRSGRFDLVLYLNDRYREYQLLPPEKRRLPPLKGF